jgi:phage tail sheath protein FI
VPEYLAPGVYVEETSFRAKSIEGVGTSTTGFVGPTRKGPVGDTPEIITSFNDFERIYGGLDDLDFGNGPRTNYLAHGVRAYFDNGGSRLYVSRVFLQKPGDAGVASVPVIEDQQNQNNAISFVSRFPGVAGNGTISMRLTKAPASVNSLRRSPEGTMVLVKNVAAGPARVEGGTPPFSIDDGSLLKLAVGGNNEQIEFKGQPAEAIANVALDANNPTVITANNGSIEIEVDGVKQKITLPPGNYTPEEVAALINQRMRAGYARVTTAQEQGGANRIVIGSDRRGRAATVSVKTSAIYGFDQDEAESNANKAADNNVPDLGRVTIDDIDALLQDPNNVIDVRATESSTGKLLLSTTATGLQATLGLVAPQGQEVSAHEALGLAVAPAVPGSAAVALGYYVKEGDSYETDQNVKLDLVTLEASEPYPDENDAPNILTMAAVTVDGDGKLMTFEDMGFDRTHPRWIGYVMAENPTRRIDALEQSHAISIGSAVTGFQLRNTFFPGTAEAKEYKLDDGDDGLEPNTGAYIAPLQKLEVLEDIAIVAAPGHSSFADFPGIQREIIKHVEKRGYYRIGVFDTPPAQAISEARSVRSQIDSKYAALYYPWVVVANPLARPGVESIPREITLPPSGFVCGIYARNDVERGVFKAPANEVVRGALRFETDINFAQQEVLNPLGVNCLRYFPGRGYRLWGARTASSDPEWKYVNVRRYFNYLESSIDRGTQWAVFEPNGERLWANVRETISSYLYNEWRNGALLGASPKEAFFVRCDRTTMTQNDLDNGRLICLIGVAVIKPAEFVIFRIGQKTADARS